MHCSVLQDAETVSQQFHELFRISVKQIFFTFLSCTAPHTDTSTNSGIPILTVLVSSHLLLNRGYNHSHYQMRGRTSKKPEPSQTVSSQGSQQPSCSCLQSSSPHHAFGNHACQAGSQIFALIFSKCEA